MDEIFDEVSCPDVLMSWFLTSTNVVQMDFQLAIAR